MTSRRKAKAHLRRWDNYLSRYPHREMGFCRITEGWARAWDRYEEATRHNEEMHLRHVVLARLDGRNIPKGWGYPWKLTYEQELAP